MCCDTMCGAQSEGCRIADCAPGVQSLCVDSMSQIGQPRRRGVVWCRSVDDITTDRHPSAMTVNPVRQCARRGASVLDVAQASPLFSDHAPREVHLWQ
jgi:hypothetical protein